MHGDIIARGLIHLSSHDIGDAVSHILATAETAAEQVRARALELGERMYRAMEELVSSLADMQDELSSVGRALLEQMNELRAQAAGRPHDAPEAPPAHGPPPVQAPARAPVQAPAPPPVQAPAASEQLPAPASLADRRDHRVARAPGVEEGPVVDERPAPKKISPRDLIWDNT